MSNTKYQLWSPLSHVRFALWRWLAWLISFAAVFFLLSFVISAVLAEGALHPLVRRRATDTAALAYSIARSANARAIKVNIRANDGTALNAWWLSPVYSNGDAVMVCHGVADSAYGALGYALFLLSNGYSVLVPESRGHGESRGYVTYGVLEADDVVQWLRWIGQRGVHSTFGFGESLGGAILIQSLARGADFRALVVECPYSSFEAVADERVARVIPSLAAQHVSKGGPVLYASAISCRSPRCPAGSRDPVRPRAHLAHSRIGRQQNESRSLETACPRESCICEIMVSSRSQTHGRVRDRSESISRACAPVVSHGGQR